MLPGERSATARKVSDQETVALGRRRKMDDEKWMLAIAAARTALGGEPVAAT
jgi:hypothetical protein